MKKILPTLVVFLGLMMAAVPQAMALEIRITSNGYIEFYEDDVLGDFEDADKREDDFRDEERSRQTEPVRVTPIQNREIQIRGNNDKTEIKLRAKSEQSGKTRDLESTPAESVEAKRFRMEFPAQLKNREDKNNDTDQKRTTGESEKKINENRREYIQKIEERRGERTKEMLELKSQQNEQGQVFELKSRHVKAQVEQGTEFTLDPSTNEVTIVTPSGKEHTLTHLPDQAIEQMRSHGLLSSSDNQVDKEIDVEVETTDDGRVVYKTHDVVKKRVFGLIPKKFKSEVTLDDETGEVKEEVVKPTTILEQFLNGVSF